MALFGIDLTPGFNLHLSPGNGIPFVSKGNGSSGQAAGTGTDAGDYALYNSGYSPIAGYSGGGGGGGGGGAGSSAVLDASSKTNQYTGGGGGGGSVLGASTTADNALYNTYGSQANTALSDLLNAYNTNKQQLGSKYSTLGNELQSNYNMAKTNYDNSVTSQNQDLLRQQNEVRQGTSRAYHNLMDMLGAYGGGAGSVALQWAPTAAQNFQNAQMGDANQTAASNLRNLNTTFGTYSNEHDKQKQQLADSQNQDLANADASYQNTRNQLNEILANIANRSVDAGTLGSEISAIRAAIPNQRFVQPTYTGNTPVYSAPSLSSFEAAPLTSNLSQVIPNNSSATPALALLLAQQRKQQQNVTPVA